MLLQQVSVCHWVIINNAKCVFYTPLTHTIVHTLRSISWTKSCTLLLWLLLLLLLEDLVYVIFLFHEIYLRLLDYMIYLHKFFFCTNLFTGSFWFNWSCDLHDVTCAQYGYYILKYAFTCDHITQWHDQYIFQRVNFFRLKKLLLFAGPSRNFLLLL